MDNLNLINSNTLSQSRFYESYKILGYDTVKRYIKDEFDRDEVVQQGFIKIFKLVDTPIDIKNLNGYLYKIFRNCALDHLRKKKYTYEYDDNLHFDTIDEVDCKQDMLTDIDVEIEKLSPIYNLVFKCYHIENMSHKDISKKLGICEGTSKSNLHKATKRIQNKLKTKIYE